MKTAILTLLFFSLFYIPNVAQVQDIDGNTYQTVIIGTQEWMAENLNTTKFSNGDPIPNITDINSYYFAGEPAWAYFNNNSSNGDIYGKLYNGLTAVDNRNCCPEGWHVPTDSEWTTLVNYAGGEAVAGIKLRNSTEWNGTDEFGFNAMPGGLRYALAGDLNEGTLFGQGFWWSSEYTSASNVDIYFYRTETFSDGFYREAEAYTLGMSIRCIKDASLGINDNSLKKLKSYVYPNPFSSKGTLVLNHDFNGEASIKIFNTTGHLIREYVKPTDKPITIDRDGLPEGFYFYTVSTSENRIINGKFIINNH